MATLKAVIEASNPLSALVRSGDYAAVAVWLGGADLINNPTREAPPVTKPITFDQVIQLVPDDEAANCYSLPMFIEHVQRAIDTDNRVWLAKLLAIAQRKGAISAGTAALLAPLLTETQADPTWQAKIAGPPRWVKLGLARAPSAADVQAAAHEAG
ncbi:MAG: hypothetical protein U0X20_23755 [Caldilineaceae bacterium]